MMSSGGVDPDNNSPTPGEIAMSASRLEFNTSFSVDGTKTFTFINGQSFFNSHDVFYLWNKGAIVIFYIDDREALHLKCEYLIPACNGLDLTDLETENPKIKIQRPEGPAEIYNLKGFLQFFKRGRGFL